MYVQMYIHISGFKVTGCVERTSLLHFAFKKFYSTGPGVCVNLDVVS
jgi:hypothetical protein